MGWRKEGERNGKGLEHSGDSSLARSPLPRLPSLTHNSHTPCLSTLLLFSVFAVRPDTYCGSVCGKALFSLWKLGTAHDMPRRSSGQ